MEQVLSDQQEFKKADEYFGKALEQDSMNATAYVHRGLLQLQWEGDIANAIRLIQQAIDLDSKCEFAYETLGTIEVQRGNLKRAIELFDNAIPLSKTEIEMAHLFSLKDAALAQVKVAEKVSPCFILFFLLFFFQLYSFFINLYLFSFAVGCNATVRLRGAI